MRRDRARLEDIQQAASLIASFVADRSEEDLECDPALASAVAYQFLVIGEAANALPKDLLDRYPGVQWLAVIALRNRLAHAYFGTDLSLVWRAASSSVPELAEYVREILAAEFPDPPEPDSPTPAAT